ncbi:hypothetical protein BV898_19616, partial [Hypsibius exemplaris]
FFAGSPDTASNFPLIRLILVPNCALLHSDLIQPARPNTKPRCPSRSACPQHPSGMSFSVAGVLKNGQQASW